MRLAVTTVVFIIAPLVAWFSIVFYRSYSEIINAREDNYLEITRSFGVSFQREVGEKLATAIQISVDSRDSRNDSFALSSALFSQNAYYYTECIRAVAQYSKLTRSRLGIYFPAVDCLFTDTYKIVSLIHCILVKNPFNFVFSTVIVMNFSTHWVCIFRKIPISNWLAAVHLPSKMTLWNLPI